MRGSIFVLQLLIVLAVLVAVVAISLAQSAATFEGSRVGGLFGRRDAGQQPCRPQPAAGCPAARRFGAALGGGAVRTISGSSQVALARSDRTVVASSDPSQESRQLELGDSAVMSGRAWTGVVGTGAEEAVAAHVPVLDDAGKMVGIAMVGRNYPSVLERLGDAVPNLLTYLGVASVLGVAGSLLLARRVKRQTLGMEPDEITGLVENREAMLHGLKEGVVALDPQQRITVVNDSARPSWACPMTAWARAWASLAVRRLRCARYSPRTSPGRTGWCLVGERLLVLNRMPMRSHGRVIGSVTTLRDRTELASLERELGTTRTATDTLRAQAHEFANQLHTISGLIQIGEYDSVVQFVNGTTSNRTRLNDDVTSRIEDPALAALLIAKSSLAAERGVSLQLARESRLGKVDEELSRDLTTVVGNLVDNALDAVTSTSEAEVVVLVGDDDGDVRVIVRDSGPGVPVEVMDDIFRQGFIPRMRPDGGRGYGLALARVVCRRRGGRLTVRNDHGAVFTALLMRRTADA